MFMFDQMGSSHLEVRQNSLLYSFIIAIIIGFFVFVLIHFIQRMIQKHRSSAEWIEAHKNLETTRKNVRNLSKKANLSHAEENLLWTVCHNAHCKNIEYLYLDNEVMDVIFKREYQRLAEQNKEELISILFPLRYKLEDLHDKMLFITSTRSLPVGQEFTYVDKDGAKFVLKLTQNDSTGLYLSLPQQLINYGTQPAALDKIMLSFTAKTGISYTLLTRVIRYSTDKEGRSIMVASSSNALKPVQHRMAKRMAFSQRATFSAIKPVKKGKKVKFEVMEKKHPGQFIDISATGCGLVCALPIKTGQLLFIEFSLDNKRHDKAVGIIVSTKKTREGNFFVLHIRFEQIDLHLQNLIYALTYNYIDIKGESADS